MRVEDKKSNNFYDRTGFPELLNAFLEDYIGRIPRTPELDYWNPDPPKQHQQFRNQYDEFLLKYGPLLQARKKK